MSLVDIQDNALHIRGTRPHRPKDIPYGNTQSEHNTFKVCRPRVKLDAAVEAVMSDISRGRPSGAESRRRSCPIISRVEEAVMSTPRGKIHSVTDSHPKDSFRHRRNLSQWTHSVMPAPHGSALSRVPSDHPRPTT